MKTLTLRIERKIPIEDIKDLLDSASRGASYWCSSSLGYESETDKIFKGEVVKMYDHEGEKNKTLDLKKVEKGLQVMANDRPADFADFVEGNYDDNTGDVFLQCCLFKDVIYG